MSTSNGVMGPMRGHVSNPSMSQQQLVLAKVESVPVMSLSVVKRYECS